MAAHARGSLHDRFFQGTARAPVDVFFGKAALGRRHLGDGLGERPPWRLTAIENAGFVEMNMAFDESGDNEPAA